MTTAATAAPQIRITAEPGATPALFRFMLDRPVINGGVYFANKEEAAGSPLAEALFAIPTVTSVRIALDKVEIGKSGEDDWVPVARQVGATLRSQMQSGATLVKAELLTKQAAADAAVRTKLEEVFASTINPAVASHGGNVELVDFRNGVVYVRMAGGCQGCASSQATLKQGIERIVREAVPDVVDIVDVTNHAAGSNPYFK